MRGHPLPQVITNASLQQEFKIATLRHQNRREEALRSGLNPPPSAMEETKGESQVPGFANLSHESLLIVDRFRESGYELPDVITNASLAEAAHRVN